MSRNDGFPIIIGHVQQVILNGPVNTCTLVCVSKMEGEFDSGPRIDHAVPKISIPIGVDSRI